MRFQWNLILGLFFALVVAVFAVMNVAPVEVNYLFGMKEIPLILVIVGSALLGGLVVGMFGIFRQYQLQWKVKKLEKDLERAKTETVVRAELVEAEEVSPLHDEMPEEETPREPLEEDQAKQK